MAMLNNQMVNIVKPWENALFLGELTARPSELGPTGGKTPPVSRCQHGTGIIFSFFWGRIGYLSHDILKRSESSIKTYQKHSKAIYFYPISILCLYILITFDLRLIHDFSADRDGRKARKASWAPWPARKSRCHGGVPREIAMIWATWLMIFGDSWMFKGLKMGESGI